MGLSRRPSRPAPHPPSPRRPPRPVPRFPHRASPRVPQRPVQPVQRRRVPPLPRRPTLRVRARPIRALRRRRRPLPRNPTPRRPALARTTRTAATRICIASYSLACASSVSSTPTAMTPRDPGVIVPCTVACSAPSIRTAPRPRCATPWYVAACSNAPIYVIAHPVHINAIRVARFASTATMTANARRKSSPSAALAKRSAWNADRMTTATRHRFATHSRECACCAVIRRIARRSRCVTP